MSPSPLPAVREPSSDRRERSEEVRCPSCERAVDPLRAGRVALLRGQFHYFCDAGCASAFLQAEPYRARAMEETAQPPPVSVPLDVYRTARPAPVRALSTEWDVDDAPATRSSAQLMQSAGEGQGRPRPARELRGAPPQCTLEPDDFVPSRRDVTLRVPPAPPEPERLRPSAPAAPRRSGLGLLLSFGSLCAALAALSSVHIGERGQLLSVLALGLTLALEAVLALRGRGRGTARALWLLLPSLAGVSLAVASVWQEQFNALYILPVLGVLAFGQVAARMLSARLAQRTAREVRLLLGVLHDSREVVVDECTLRGGEFVPVDGEIVAGAAEFALHGARPDRKVRLGLGALVPASAKLLSGEVTLRTQATGDARVVSRWLGQGQLSELWPARYAKLERLVWLGTLLAPLVVGLFAWVSREEPWQPLLLAVTLWSSFGLLFRLELPQLLWARTALSALERGVLFPSFSLLERASRTEQLVLAGRGVVFAGEPELVDFLWVQALSEDEAVQLLGEVVGAEQGAEHPLGPALAAALTTERARRFELPCATPDATALRTAREVPGLGVVAQGPHGRVVVIGNRELMLRHAVSVAAADGLASAIEAERRELLYIARDGRLLAVAVLEDGVREGCLESVQALHQAGVEPVLLSGASRSVCEAVGERLEIDHVRAEVLPADRGAVVRSLIESGRVVGHLGVMPRDQEPLLESDVGVAFGAAEPRVEQALVRLCRDDLAAAVWAFTGPRETRERVRRLVVAALLVPVLIALPAGFGLFGAWALLLGALLSLALALQIAWPQLRATQNSVPNPRRDG